MTSSYHLEDKDKCNKNACASTCNVPKLRFKGYNDEWKHFRLKDIVKIYDGTHQTPNYIDDGIKFVSVENIGNLEGTNKYISKVDYDKDFKIKPEINDILMTRIGDIGTPAIIDTKENYAYYVSLALLKADQEILFPKFFVQRILSEPFQHELWKRTLHVAFPKKINKNEIGECNVFICSKSEQEKIASFLTLIDKKIEKQKKLVELLKKYKRGLLSAIFSQKLRFKDNNGNDYPAWEEKYIQDVCSITTGKGNTQDKEDNGVYPFYVRSPIVEKSNKYIFDGEAVLTVGDGVGTGKVFHYVNGKFNFHQRVYKMSNFLGINGRYFYYYFSTHFYDRVKRMTAKTSVDSVRMDMIAKMPIFIPTNEEQDKIINLLTNEENIFLKNENLLLLLNEYKKGLLQQMFI